jgi:DNA replication protein DnaC
MPFKHLSYSHQEYGQQLEKTPGVGKTYLSIALSIKALEVGYSVLFTTLAYLATDLATAPHAAALKQRMRRYLAPKVLVIDEVGYTRLKHPVEIFSPLANVCYGCL